LLTAPFSSPVVSVTLSSTLSAFHLHALSLSSQCAQFVSSILLPN
jgi:hypothetical protein